MLPEVGLAGSRRESDCIHAEQARGHDVPPEEADLTFPLPNVPDHILVLVIAFMEHYHPRARLEKGVGTIEWYGVEGVTAEDDEARVKRGSTQLM